MIALGRAMLACVFLLAVWLDSSQPRIAAAETYILLIGYMFFSIAMVAVIWNDWWRDARLAPPAHVFDVLIFTILVVSTAGYTSPFFLFFMFVLFSAAIRWGWRETAITAAALIILYLSSGIAVAARSAQDFELERFIIRGGHLIILSGLLIWFGVHQRSSFWAARVGGMPQAEPDTPLLHALLVAAAQCAGARSALFVWLGSSEGEEALLRYSDGSVVPGETALPLFDPGETEPFLYDLAEDHALYRGRNAQPLFGRARDSLRVEAARQAGLSQGLAVPIQSESGRGALFLERIPGLSIDHLELGELLSMEIANRIRRRDLFDAVEASAEARARLGLARDLHDSIVQFLAGAAFRIEALIRRSKAGADVSDELRELKRLMLDEQMDLRASIQALRKGREVELEALIADLNVLAERLGQQWSIECRFKADAGHRTVPARLLIDAQQLVRESVANAVRHGKATSVDIAVSADEESLRLSFIDDGDGMPQPAASGAGGPLEPRSLKERVTDAGGELQLQPIAKGTWLTISLPIGNAA